MSRRSLAAVVLGTIILVALIYLARPVAAAPRADASCWWEGSTLHATGLPDEYSVTAEFYPIGVTEGPDTLALTFHEPFTAYFWTRGGPGMRGAPKAGPQLSDYKVICIAGAS